jgi:GT2 family glycosyltransferase
MPSPAQTKVGIVVIGRNEGERLVKCLLSARGNGAPIVYVDSGSTDSSVKHARDAGCDVVTLNMDVPFTAARARNAGFARLHASEPTLPYVQFVDGDCEIAPDWIGNAAAFLDNHPDAVVACGRRRERFPERSVYNWLCDREWNTPVGKTKSCGGDALMRADMFEKVGGFRADLIAGEEPELCVRLRRAGGEVWRLDEEMTLHDANLTRFSQWWRRAVRSGYAQAQGAFLHGAPPEQHKVWETRRAWIWGFWLPIACLVCVLLFGPYGWLAFLIYPLQFLRQVMRTRGDWPARVTMSFFQLVARFAESWGQLKFTFDRLSGRQTRIIEYK